MKRSKVKKSGTAEAMLITGKELHELDRVCAGLVDATEHARQANEILAPDVPDTKARPVPPLQSLNAGKAQLGQSLEVMRTSLKAVWRGGDAELRTRLLTHWLHFAYMGAVPLLQKKSQLALAMGKRNAATKFETAFDTIPPRDKTEHPNGWRDIEREASRIAAAITPDRFYLDIRMAFMLDAEATAEINGTESQKTITAVLVGEQAKQLATAADNSQAAVDEMGEWQGYIKQLIAGYDGDGISPSPLTANKQQAIYERWDEYTTDCKRKHTRPTYEGCLDEHGRDDIYKGHTLLELVQTAQGLKRVVHNVKEQARRK